MFLTPPPLPPLVPPLRYDYVEVRDGVDESGQLVGKYCGKIAPSPVVSSGNQLFIKFVSDYETHGAGFSIRYEIFKMGGWPSLCSLCPWLNSRSPRVYFSAVLLPPSRLGSCVLFFGFLKHGSHTTVRIKSGPFK